MFIKQLATSNPAVQLVKPHIERDAPLSVAWLDGQSGRDTLKMMGVIESQNQASDVEHERKRIQGFLDGDNRYSWMIQFQNTIVGSIWVDRHDSKKLKGPAISLMIGDLATRGQGVGRAAVEAVIGFLRDQGHNRLYARHMVENEASGSLLKKLGFETDGAPYTDEDGLTWQNLTLSLGQRL